MKISSFLAGNLVKASTFSSVMPRPHGHGIPCTITTSSMSACSLLVFLKSQCIYINAPCISLYRGSTAKGLSVRPYGHGRPGRPGTITIYVSLKSILKHKLCADVSWQRWFYVFCHGVSRNQDIFLSVFMCTFLQYHINSSKTRRSNSPQFSCLSIIV